MTVCGTCKYPVNVCKCDEDMSWFEDEIKSSKDNIEPNHYTKWKIPPNVYITENNLEWEPANIVKYITRYVDKNGKEDLLKASKYIDMLIARKYSNS